MTLVHSHDTAVRDAARALSTRTQQGTARPMPLGAWGEVTRTGTVAPDSDPDATAAGLVRRWSQHLAVAIDLPMERYAPGAERLPALLTAWLDLARRTEAVRAHVAAVGGPRTTAEQRRQSGLLVQLLAEDLAVLGALDPRRAAADLLAELAQVAAAEDAAGKPLPAARQALLGGGDQPPRRSWLESALDRVAGWLRPGQVTSSAPTA